VTLNAGASIGALAIAIVLAHRWVGRLLGSLPKERTKIGSLVLVVVALPFALIQIVQLLGTQVDLWVAERVLDSEQTGLYAASLRLMSLVTMPLHAAQLTLVAGVSALYVLGRPQLLEFRVRRAATVAAVPAMAALVVCIVFPAAVLGVLFGDQFRGGATVLSILAVGQVVNVLSGLCGIVLAMTGHERLVLAVSLSAAAASAVAGWLGATVGGSTGLAVASAATTSATFAAFWYLARARCGVWTHPYWPSRRLLVEPDWGSPA
jgi:O-antigen/teichoic acid export membrane protein